jgi:hypothetical protein
MIRFWWVFGRRSEERSRFCFGGARSAHGGCAPGLDTPQRLAAALLAVGQHSGQAPNRTHWQNPLAVLPEQRPAIRLVPRN